MKITADQMKAFQRSADRTWVGDLCRHLRVHHSNAVARFSEEELREEVARGIERARAHGLYARSKVGFFVALLFEIGPAFDEHPRIRRLLASRRCPPDDRITEIVRAMSEEEWEQARRLPPRGSAHPSKET
jgi:DNA invertase Pin-like site-specific DNA recombinase